MATETNIDRMARILLEDHAELIERFSSWEDSENLKKLVRLCYSQKEEDLK